MEGMILCAANSASMGYYFNEDFFGRIPERIKYELKIICVTYCADVGGIITLGFDAAGKLQITTMDPIDEIGSELLIGRMQREHEELFSQMEEYYAYRNR